MMVEAGSGVGEGPSYRESDSSRLVPALGIEHWKSRLPINRSG